MIADMTRRARLDRITDRASELERLRSMLEGTYEPAPGEFSPRFKPGARQQAWQRALKNVTNPVPVIISKSLAALAFGSTTWSDTSSDAGTGRVNDALDGLDLPQLARDLATEYRLAGVCAAMASVPIDGEQAAPRPTITVLKGTNMPYTAALDPARVSGWYRALEYVAEGGRLRWWVDAIEFHADGTNTHRAWRALEDPTRLAFSPDVEIMSTTRPRYALYGVQQDGMPVSALLANEGRILGLYGTELRLATVEELSSFPMLLAKGNPEFDQIGPGEVITVDADGDVTWLDPGNLEPLSKQVDMRREAVREAFNLPGGALGSSNQMPSGVALEEANRGFLQETTALADAVSRVLTDVVSDYLGLLGLPPVDVQVPIDKSYTRDLTIRTLEKGLDLGAVPVSVAARVFQQQLGAAYSDAELERFLNELEAREQVHSFLTSAPLDNDEPESVPGEAP